MSTVHVDLGPALAKIRLALTDYSIEVQRRATYNAINAVGDPLRTAVRRLVREQSGVPYSRVMKAITAKRAHPNNLSYALIARDKAIPLVDMAKGVKPGQIGVRATTWDKGVVFYPHAFVVTFNGQMSVVKRIGKHQGRGTRLRVKSLWGAILPREMLRPNKPSLQEIARAVPTKLLPRLLHELKYASERAKIASGT